MAVVGEPISVGLVEDDPALRTSLVKGLREEGFVVIPTATGSEFVRMVIDRVPDVLVIDIGLPDADGRDACSAIRAHGITSPALFLTARSSVGDLLSGFAAGGDDYVVKPFSFDELVARLYALSRRLPSATGLFAGSGVVVDPRNRSMQAHDGLPMQLTPTELRLMAVLASADGGVVDRASLVRAGWPGGGYVSDNTLDSFVARLRRKLRSSHAAAPTIATIRGVGYRLQ